MYNIVGGDGFNRMASFTPSHQTSDDYERVESSLPQHVRHTGAGGLACSSTVEINILVLGKPLDLFGELIRLDADGTFDAGGTPVVVTVAANIHH